jgi:hypothetical protein
MNIISKLQELSLTQKYLAKIFNCRPQQIFSAIHNNDQPTLKMKIIKHLSKIENKRNGRKN